MKTSLMARTRTGLALLVLASQATAIADGPQAGTPPTLVPPTSWRTARPAPTPPSAFAPPAPPFSGPAKAQPADPEGTLTPGTLPARLAAAGYPTKVEGPNLCVITARQGTWTAPVKVSISKGGTHVWLILAVKSDLPTYDQISGERLARLLEANDAIGPCHFAIEKTTRQLTINLPLPNRPMTPEVLRNEIEAFVEKAISTQTLWAD